MKTLPLGTDSNNLAFTNTEIMIRLEIQKGKKKIFSIAHTDLNLMTNCSLCLDGLSIYSGKSLSINPSTLIHCECK